MGEEKPGEGERCVECGGSGRIMLQIQINDTDTSAPCPACKGTGRQPAAPTEAERCENCGNDGHPCDVCGGASRPTAAEMDLEKVADLCNEWLGSDGYCKRGRGHREDHATEIQLKVERLETALAASKAQAEANLNAAASLEVVRDDLGRQLAASKARVGELQELGEQLWVWLEQVQLGKELFERVMLRRSEKLSAAQAENARLREDLRKTGELFDAALSDYNREHEANARLRVALQLVADSAANAGPQTLPAHKRFVSAEALYAITDAALAEPTPKPKGEG